MDFERTKFYHLLILQVKYMGTCYIICYVILQKGINIIIYLWVLTWQEFKNKQTNQQKH